MSFVVMELRALVRVTNSKTGRNSYKTEAAAKAACTRLHKQHVDNYINSNGAAGRKSYVVWPMQQFLDLEPKMIQVRNLMTGKKVTIAADTPLCCNPSSETYWSM